MGKDVKLVKTSDDTSSKQVSDDSLFSTEDNIVQPGFEFDVLMDTYDCSSIISGIIGKISVKTAAKFKKTESEELNMVLKNIDIESMTTDILVFGNCFLERLKYKTGKKSLKFDRIVTPTIRVLNKNQEKNRYIQRSDNNSEKVFFKGDEVLHLKRNSIGSKYYGDSIFYSSVDEIILLSYITKYFKKYFKNGNINPTILYDESESLTDDQMDKIESLIKDRLSGIENADTTILLKGKLGKIELATIFDPEKYIALKRELKEDIAIDLNIPFDLLSTKNSNRSNSETAMSILYDDIIIPLQNKICNQIRRTFMNWYENEKDEECWSNISEENIQSIEFENINLRDPKDEMTTLTGYQKNGNLSVNEVRAIAGLGGDIEGGDEYKIINGKDSQDEVKEMEKLKDNIKKMYASTKS